MNKIDEPNVNGPRRHVRVLALDAVAAFGLVRQSVRLGGAHESFNTVFRVADAGGEAYALRIGAAECIHAVGTEGVEVQWMRELRDGGIVTPPVVFDTPDGAPFVRLTRPGVHGERVCMMFGWIDGARLSEAMTIETVRQMGALAGVLHESAPAADIASEPPLVADRVLYWKLENRLHELDQRGSLMTEALDRAQRDLDRIWARRPHRPMLVHGDLTPDNVIAGPDGLVPIDFQDLFWGFDIQDLAITLTSLARFPDADRLQDALRRGYRDVRAWPELDEPTLASLAAARRLHQLNLALNLRRPGWQRYVERVDRLIAEWMA